MAKLKFLDLSSNALGTRDGQEPYTRTDQWCPPATSYGAASPSYGWCPSGTPLGNTMPNLVTLDLSDNQFQGELPLSCRRPVGWVAGSRVGHAGSIVLQAGRCAWPQHLAVAGRRCTPSKH